MTINCAPTPKHRLKVIRSVAAGLLNNQNTEREALSLFLWKLSDMEPPVSVAEQLYFCALYRMNKGYTGFSFESVEAALEMLNINSKNAQFYSTVKLLKAAKLAYWKQYNYLTETTNLLLTHAYTLGVKKKAFDFLAGYASADDNN